MAMVVRVKPEYNGKIAVQSSNSYNGIILSNDLSQATLVQIYNTEDELRDFLYTTYTTVGDSYAPSQIDPSLIHAYASEEITHNPAKTDYPANTVGKHLNETRGKIDAFDGAFVGVSTRPSLILDFANARFIDPRYTISRQGDIATFIDRNGFIKISKGNRPRFTHDPSTKESLGLLEEELRTNLIIYSNDFTRWNNLKASIITSDVIAPDGSFAQKLVEDNSNNTAHQVSTAIIPILAGNTYTFSCFVRGGERVYASLVGVGGALFGGSNPIVVVNLGLGQIISTSNCLSSSITPYNNGWYRVSWTQVATTSGNSGINIQLHNGITVTYQGDGASGLYIFGAQLEVGNDRTSYIPTSDSPVTRNTDIMNLSSDVFANIFSNITEGSILLVAKKPKSTSANKKFYNFSGVDGSISLGSLQNQDKVYLEVLKNGVSQFQNGSLIVSTDEFFISLFSFKLNNSKLFIGSNEVADIDIIPPSQLNQLQIGGDINTIIRQFAFWPRKLSDAEAKSIVQNLFIGKKPSQIPNISDLGSCAFIRPEAILRSKSRQEFSIDGTGAALTRNIRRDYDFTFEIVDSSGVTITAQPASSCTAGTDNALTFTAPLGKTLTYAITPVYEN
ncbi:phage head spike fiber domain-containing protein [Flectobacillus roseus]